MNFIFLTRCYTPVNLSLIKSNIKNLFRDTEHSYKHLIVVDLERAETNHKSEEFSVFADDVTSVFFVRKPENDSQNTFGMDEALASVHGDFYVYVLDDDNILHQDFLKVCNDCNEEDAIVFRILGSPCGSPEIMKMYAVCHIDWANYITKLDVMQRLKIYHPDSPRMCEDGIFFEKMKENKCKIKFIDKVYAYYNKFPRRGV